MNKKITNEETFLLQQNQKVKSEILKDEHINKLPYPVKNWLKNSGCIGKEMTRTVFITQKAKMKMKPNQEKWYAASAEQLFALDKPGFVWTVKLKMSPIIKIRGRDIFIDGKGAMLIRMNSLINIVNEKGPKIDEGTAQRFLGEIVWFPSAAVSSFITWEPIDKLSAKATFNYKGTMASGIFYFNDQGDIIKFSALRYKENEPDAKRYEWVIKVKQHSILNGVKIPTQMEATWILESGPWTWLELDILDVKYNL